MSAFYFATCKGRRSMSVCDYNKLVSATWPRGLKRRCYGDRMITIAWSTFYFHPHRTRCCVLE